MATRVLLTGGAGSISSTLERTLLGRSDDVQIATIRAAEGDP